MSAMDWADVSIEGAGVALVAVLVGSAFALVANRRRIVLGACLGLGLGLLVLPFVAILVARLTNNNPDITTPTPPPYLVATALACGGLALLGALGGILSEARRRSPPVPLREPSDEDYIDDPARWLPWRPRQDDPSR
jgi:hypothetical protein